MNIGNEDAFSNVNIEIRMPNSRAASAMLLAQCILIINNDKITTYFTPNKYIVYINGNKIKRKKYDVVICRDHGGM